MRINPSYNNYYRHINSSKPSFGSGFDPYFQVSTITQSDLGNITKLITDCDEAMPDGSIQRLYKYCDFMIKAPDPRTEQTAVKEFYALLRIGQADTKNEVSPCAKAVSKIGERHFLVEDYIQGEHAGDLPFSLDEVDQMLKKFTVMDKGGVVNHDLSPRNIIVMPNKQRRIVDFDSFSFVTDSGRVMLSKNTMPHYFVTRLPKNVFADTNYSSVGNPKAENLSKANFSQMFANTFTVAKRTPTGAQDLNIVRSLSENPYIGAPSNLSNYEGNTIFQRIIANDINDPVNFLRTYIQKKAKIYHPKMKEFLETLSINPELCGQNARLPFEEAQKRLDEAIEYEELLSRLFKEKKPDIYFTKLEAAKIQLSGLMHMTKKDGGPDFDQIHSAYDRLIKIITDGIKSYKEPDYQKYLQGELKRYTNAFEHTNFATKRPKVPVAKNLDIVEIWFSDSGYDTGAYYAVKDKIKHKAIDAAISVAQKSKPSGIPDAEIHALQKDTVVKYVRESLEHLDGRLTTANVDRCSSEITSDVMGYLGTKKARQVVSKMTYSPLEDVKKALRGIYEAPAQITKEAFEDEAFGRIETFVPELKNFKKPEDVIMTYVQKYQKQNYIKNGARLYKGLALVLGAACFVGYQIMSYKKNKGDIVEGIKNREFIG